MNNGLKLNGSPQGQAGTAIQQIAAAIRALQLPQSSFYFACNHERLNAKKGKFAALENCLRETFQKGFVAAVQLTSLVEPNPSHSGDYSSVVANYSGEKS